MPYPEEFPHEVLGLERNFSEQDLKQALGNAIKKNPAQLNKYRAAHKALATIGERLIYEALQPYENDNLITELNEKMAELGEPRYLPEVCPCLPLSIMLYELSNMDYQADFQKIDFELPEVVYSADYDKAKEATLPIIFDR